ncbi:hypothetical protein [Pararhizobium sp. O133]|uniref:hypothetical protein n=1 Tax=Pararhizobium sp. O133 TaxID=3449278 RepID=UPI003F684932
MTTPTDIPFEWTPLPALTPEQKAGLRTWQRFRLFIESDPVTGEVISMRSERVEFEEHHKRAVRRPAPDGNGSTGPKRNEP